MEVGGSVQKHEMHTFPACLEGESHSLSFLYLRHLWVLVSMDEPREFGQDAATCFMETPMSQMTLRLGASQACEATAASASWPLELVKIQDRCPGEPCSQRGEATFKLLPFPHPD